MNLLLGVGFNREVGGQGALYWEKKAGSLSKLSVIATVCLRMTGRNLNGKRKNALPATIIGIILPGFMRSVLKESSYDSS